MKRVHVRKSGWNTLAAVAGPFWYLSRGMLGKGILLLIICIITFGTGILPVWIYCGLKGNCDFYKYLKARNAYIHSKSSKP